MGSGVAGCGRGMVQGVNPPSPSPACPAAAQGTIEGRRDIRGGRLQSDRRTAANSSSGAAFTSLAYSADGALLLAGGNSK
jgi:hypothetical protein